MSGIEAAGLILGLWPIISSLVVTYRDARAGEALTKLAMEVKVHESIYKGWLRNLLQGHDQLTDIQIQTLMEPTADAAWQKSDIQQHLREILPHDTFESIDFALSEIHEAMKILERILRKGDVDVSNASSRTMLRKRIKGTFHHAMAMIPQSEFQQAHDRLRKNVDSLERLSRPFQGCIWYPKFRAQLWKGRQVSKSRQRPMPKRHTNTFYEALETGLRECNCHDGHDTSLRIYCEDFFHVVLGVDDSERAPPNLLLSSRDTFNAVHLAENCDISGSNDESPRSEAESPLASQHADRMTSRKEASIWSLRSGNLGMTKRSQAKYAIQFEFSTESPTPTGKTAQTPVDLELCMILKHLSAAQPNAAQSSEPQQSFGTLRRGETVFTARGKPEMLPDIVECLEDRIQGLGKSKKKRDEIAQNLAFAVIQFASTHWIDSSWTWRSFSVREDEVTGLQQLFVTRRIVPDREARNPALIARQSRFWRLLTREPVLVRLGFALIELALARRLPELRAEGFGSEALAELAEGEASEDEKDYLTALAVMESRELKENCSLEYQGVVDACLTCQVAMESSYLSLTSRASSFQDDVDMHIVQPLRHSFEKIWGTSSW